MKTSTRYSWLLAVFILSGCETLKSTWYEWFPDPKPAVEDSGFRKRFLVLRPLNKTVYDAEGSYDVIFEEIKKSLGEMKDVVLVSESDAGFEAGATSGAGFFNMQAIYDLARVRGMSGIIAPTIEELGLDTRQDTEGVFPSLKHKIQATLKIQIYEVATERVLFSRVESITMDKDKVLWLADRIPANEEENRINDGVREATSRLVRDFPMVSRRISWSGQIIKAELHRFFVNGGEESGLQKGQLLRVFAEGYPVVDERSKVTLGKAPGVFKGVLKIVDFVGNDGALAVVQSGGGFAPKDRVEIYGEKP